MKGGLAVMLALASLRDSLCDCTFIFYAREELARSESGLLELDASVPELLRGDAAILLEPTAAVVEAGCQGVVKAKVTLRGRHAHVARPWVGINAVHRLAPLLERVVDFGDRRVVLDGCEYRESLQAVNVGGGTAENVVPDEATCLLVYRFAPDKDEARAFAVLEGHLGPCLEVSDRLELVDSAPAAPPFLAHPLLDALVFATGRPPGAKLGWTDVAFFAERGIPAANFGPGDPLLAHGPDEAVSRAELEATYDALARVLSSSWPSASPP
jgi:succinyl-diaminopimelate desuccinylase